MVAGDLFRDCVHIQLKFLSFCHSPSFFGYHVTGRAGRDSIGGYLSTFHVPDHITKGHANYHISFVSARPLGGAPACESLTLFDAAELVCQAYNLGYGYGDRKGS